MDSLTISPSMLRRATMPDELLLSENMFEWPDHQPQHHSIQLHQLSIPSAQQTLSPPEMETVMGSGNLHGLHHSTGGKSRSQLQKTPVRQRAISAYPEMLDAEKGLVTPVSLHNTPRGYWAGQKLEFMTPNSRDEYATAYNTPLATPVPLAPCSPLFEKSIGGAAAVGAGTNPFYNPPMCMRRSVSPPQHRGMIPDKIKAASAAEEALANFRHSPTDAQAHAAHAAHAAAAHATHSPIHLRYGEHSPIRQGQLSPLRHGQLTPLRHGQLTPLRHDELSPLRQVEHSPIYAPPAPPVPSARAAVSLEPVDEPEKPFACTHCTKAFRRMEHLRRHIKIHTKERPFNCEIPGCGRQFSRNDNLKAHMKTHAKPTGRNIYVEGLEIPEVQATPKRRKVQ